MKKMILLAVTAAAVMTMTSAFAQTNLTAETASAGGATHL